MDNYTVLLFYRYITIKNPNIIWESHKKYCSTLNLKGRIIIAKEGINGTVSGPTEDCNKYKKYIKNLIGITDMDFKDETCGNHLFSKMSIKVKNEIIRMGVDVNPQKITGKHLSPREFKIMMKNPESIILDMRSNYEHHIGKFKNAISFDIKNMYEFPKKLENHKLFLDKTNLDRPILTYCTGGIKCEKATSFLLDKGFKKVYQLRGGIIKYSTEEDGQDFDGKCYVFDDRITKNVNLVNPVEISKCYICSKKCSVMVNCMNTKCNLHTTICKKCYYKMDYCCSFTCSESDTKRNIYIDYFDTPN